MPRKYRSSLYFLHAWLELFGLATVAVDFSFPFSARFGVRPTDTISTVVTAPLAAFAFWLVGGGVGLPLRWALLAVAALSGIMLAAFVLSWMARRRSRWVATAMDRPRDPLAKLDLPAGDAYRGSYDSGDPGLASRKLEFAIRDAPHRFTTAFACVPLAGRYCFAPIEELKKLPPAADLDRSSYRMASVSVLLWSGWRIGRVIFNRPVLVDRAEIPLIVASPACLALSRLFDEAGGPRAILASGAVRCGGVSRHALF